MRLYEILLKNTKISLLSPEEGFEIEGIKCSVSGEITMPKLTLPWFSIQFRSTHALVQFLNTLSSHAELPHFTTAEAILTLKRYDESGVEYVVSNRLIEKNTTICYFFPELGVCKYISLPVSAKKVA